MANLIYKIETKSDGNISVSNIPAIITNKWWRFKHSFEIERWREARVPYVPRIGDPPDLKTYAGGMARGWNPLYFPRLPKTGLPDVITPLYDDWMGFTKAWQLYNFELMRLSSNGSMSLKQLKAAFIPIFDSGRFLLNGSGVDVYHDYINGFNATKADPRFESLGMGGSVVKEIRRVSYAKEWWLVVECLPAVPSMTTTWKNAPHLIHHAVGEYMNSLGKPAVSEFPQLNGAPVYYAFASTHREGGIGVQWIRESWLTKG